MRGNRYWSGADIVMEVVSPDDKSRKRDYEQKVADYVEARIPEYWIVDPQRREIAVLQLAGNGSEYIKADTYRPGSKASSLRLPGFSVDVAETFAAADA